MRAILLILMIALTGCSTTRLVNVHKPLSFTKEQCNPRLPSEYKRQILPSREGETIELEKARKKDVLLVADFYSAKITTLCNIAAEHDKIHSNN